MYWDGRESASVECPVGDFFCAGWQEFHQISTLAVCVNPGQGFNCYWSMPFRRHCRMTLENRMRGQGHYVGTYLAGSSNSGGWWGEGEVKFYLDGDGEYPTICGTGLEDYIGGSNDFEDQHSRNRYIPFTTPYSGFYEVRCGALEVI